MGNPQTISDGKNGAIIVWVDQRDGGAGIYAQHLDSNGKEMWKHNGLSMVKNPTFAQTSPQLCTDDSGGAYITWLDNRYLNSGNYGLCVFAQHVRSNGSLMYPDSGLPIAIGPQDRANVVLTDDGRGNAFVAFEDQRSSVVSTRPDIYMNKLWPGGVKYGVFRSTTGYVKTFHPGFGQPNYSRYFDTSAHFKPYMIGLQLMLQVNGVYTKYDIAAVLDDTTLRLGTYPVDGTYTSYIDGPLGQPVDTVKNKQTAPSICDDGAGGIFLAWTSSATVPTSIYATRIDSGGKQLWNPEPGPGFLVFQGLCGGCSVQPHSKNVSIRRDGAQLLLTWETTNVTSVDTQDIWATRIRNNTTTDTAHMWGGAIQVTGDMLYNQTAPQIFSDDSATTGAGNPRGVLVLFENTKPGSSDDQDVSMIRVLGGGDLTNQRPGNGATYNFATVPHGQMGFEAVKMDSGILAVWNDARYYGSGPDTCVYAQRLDKYGNAYLPTYHPYTGSGYYKLAKPICHGQRGDGTWWTSKQAVIAPRTNGGIIVWTDYRKGTSTPNIYSQLVWKDASLPIELASFNAVCKYRGQVDIAWKTASEQENAGFEIQRRTIESSDNTDFVTIAGYTDNSALRSAGSSNTERNYGWTDRSVQPAVYEYRLVEVALDGSRLAHDAKRVDARYGETVDSWSLGPNQPNPFADRTTLPLALPTNAIVDLTIFDVTGRVLYSPVAHQLLTRGVHEVVLDRNALSAQANGGLMARVIAFDPTTGAMIWQSEKPVMMTVLH